MMGGKTARNMWSADNNKATLYKLHLVGYIKYTCLIHSYLDLRELYEYKGRRSLIRQHTRMDIFRQKNGLKGRQLELKDAPCGAEASGGGTVS